MKLTDLLKTKRVKGVLSLGRVCPAHWCSSFIGHEARGETKGDAEKCAVGDVAWLVANQAQRAFMFDSQGQTHIVIASIGGWAHIITGPNRRPGTSYYPQTETIESLKSMIQENWEIVSTN